MDTVKAFVRADNTVTIICPNCNMPKNVSVGSFKNKCHFLRVRCPCETVFRVRLDFRGRYRKQTELPGQYKSIKPGGMSGEVHIRDLSQSGVGFTLPDVHFIEKGHTLFLSFELDDKKRTRLTKEVIVMSVDKNFIGCRFVEKQAYEKELGFYLKS